MKNYLKADPWKILETEFIPDYNRISESIFSIGNGQMGQRANFEEEYSGDSLQGSYVAGVYYPDKTRVGWWKNGYPEYFAKVLNAPNWIAIGVRLDGEVLDLAKCQILNFSRVLNMQEGYLLRNFRARLESGKEVEVQSKRFCSIADPETAAIEYKIKALNFSGKLELTPAVDADVRNKDANYDEMFWEELHREANSGEALVNARTRKTEFDVCTGMRAALYKDGIRYEGIASPISRPRYTANILSTTIEEGKEATLIKYAALVSSLNYERDALVNACKTALTRAQEKGFEGMLEAHKAIWAAKWEESDIQIEGDIPAQQGIRFNIFQLNQTYTGEDPRLNIGPKGFTGEKYGGSTYWDTEAYCLPFYLSTADPHVARNLLLYRYHHLQKAIDNAKILGIGNGAALYPMVTMNGEECHNEWEITFEEIHRNGAIAYAIYDYVRYTGDQDYLISNGLEVLIGIARYWVQRVSFSQPKQQYVMLGVTGPNEYENNVNNNWYTNYIAAWCMRYAAEVAAYVKEQAPDSYNALTERLAFAESEPVEWNKVASNLYLPEDAERKVFLQQEGFLDKELIPVSELPATDRPLNQNWSWDRILRSCYIKQADTLQGLYFFEDQFDLDTIRRNFDFYEPLTVHESSLSPCVHVILASLLGYQEKAYEMYIRTARLDLDDYNNDTEDGLHITSMAGTWMAFVKGFGGMRVRDDKLVLSPWLPEQWKSFSFQIRFRGAVLQVEAAKTGITVRNESDIPVEVILQGSPQVIEAKGQLSLRQGTPA